MNGFGGMVTAESSADLAGCKRFLERVKLFTWAESFGGTDSLIEHPTIMIHAMIPPERRRAVDKDASLVRLSVGIEDADDLIADLDQALAGLA